MPVTSPPIIRAITNTASGPTDVKATPDSLFKVFDFSNLSLDEDIQYVRNDTVATYRDLSGKLQTATANTPRFDHDNEGNFLGLLCEVNLQNKIEMENANPVVTTGITTSGSGTVTIVDDSAELAAAGLDDVCTSGMVFKAEATTSSTFAVYLPGAVGNTNSHSMSFYARGEGTGTRTAIINLGGDSLNVAPASGGYIRYTHENLTPDGTTRKFTIAVDGNDTLYFILPQLEEYPACTSVIVGDNATRQKDVIRINDLDEKNYFNPSEGFIAFHGRLFDTTTRQFFYGISDNSSSQMISSQISNNNDLYYRGFVTATSSQHVFASLVRPPPKEPISNFVAWDSSGIVTIGSNGVIDRRDSLTLPTGLNILNIGARNNQSGPISGHIKIITIGKRYDLTAAGFNSLDLDATDLYGGFGQSNEKNGASVITGNAPLGYEAFIEELESYKTDKQVNRVLMATGGSSLIKASVDPSTNYFLDVVGNQFSGEAGVQFITALSAYGKFLKDVRVSQFEGDVGAAHDGTISVQDWENAMLYLIDFTRDFTNRDLPFKLDPVGRRTAEYSAESTWQLFRESQRRIVSLRDNVYLLPEKVDLEMSSEATGSDDSVHLSDAGYQEAFRRDARFSAYLEGLITVGALPPTISGASLSGSTITVNISHVDGTDFTPSTGIEGFKFFDDGVEIPISSAIQADANTITINLSSTPSSSNKTLYYCYGIMLGVNRENLVKDNSTHQLPLQSATITL